MGICITDSHGYIPETNTILSISYSPIKKFLSELTAKALFSPSLCSCSKFYAFKSISVLCPQILSPSPAHQNPLSTDRWAKCHITWSKPGLGIHSEGISVPKLCIIAVTPAAPTAVSLPETRQIIIDGCNSSYSWRIWQRRSHSVLLNLQVQGQTCSSL